MDAFWWVLAEVSLSFLAIFGFIWGIRRYENRRK